MYLEVYHLNCSAVVDFKIIILVLSSCALPFLSLLHSFTKVFWLVLFPQNSSCSSASPGVKIPN